MSAESRRARQRSYEDSRAIASSHLYIGNIRVARDNWAEALEYVDLFDSRFRTIGIDYHLPDIGSVVGRSLLQPGLEGSLKGWPLSKRWMQQEIPTPLACISRRWDGAPFVLFMLPVPK